MHSVPRWYLGPFVPGLLVFLGGMALDPRAGRAWPAILFTALLSVATFVFIALRNRAAAHKLDVEISALPLD